MNVAGAHSFRPFSNLFNVAASRPANDHAVSINCDDDCVNINNLVWFQLHGGNAAGLHEIVNVHC